MGLQYERPWLIAYIQVAIASLGLTYQVRIMNLASTVFKIQLFKNKSYLNTLGCKFDLKVK